MELDENFEISPCALQERRSTSELIQRLVPRLSGAPAHFRPLKQGFGQIRLPLRATHLITTRVGFEPTTNTRASGSSTIELSGVGGKGYLYTAPLPVTAVAIYSHSFLINIPVRFVKLLLELRINNNMASMTRFHGKLRRAVKSCYLLPKISLQPLMRD